MHSFDPPGQPRAPRAPAFSRRTILGALGLATPALAGLLPACGSPPPDPNISVFLTVNEMLPGPHRFPFVVVDGERTAVTGARIQVRFLRLVGERDEFRFEAPAQEFVAGGSYNHVHEDGRVHVHDLARSYYLVDDANFDEGLWRADLEVHPANDSAFSASTVFQVGQRTATPRVGDPAPGTVHDTVDDVADLNLLTAADPPLSALYGHTVADALAANEPFLVAFSTPAFCTSAMCGPVTAVVGDLHGQLGDRVRFIHLEPFDLNIARTEGRLVWADVAREWNLETEPWVFVVNAAGHVAARFEGLVGAAELQPAIAAVAGPPLR